MRKVGRVIVVGGGVAGLGTALHLSERGVPVLLLETRTKLGGRATSFTDVRTGETIDNCQHVVMGCCTNYLDFCRKLGVERLITWTDETYWVEAGGRTSVMRRGALPAPGHFSGSFVALAFLSASEKVALGSALGALMREDRSRCGGITFGQWLARHDQSPSVISKFWAPVVVSACNLDVGRVCAATAIHVFQEGFLAHRDAAMVGVSSVPLVRLYDPAEGVIRAAGGDVRLSCGVERVWPDRVLTTGGELIDGDAVVLTVPPERAARMVDPAVLAMDRRFGPMSRVEHSPILGVHLVFDRPVLARPHAVLVDRPTQWLFRKDAEGRKVHAVISACDEWIGLGEEEVTARVLVDLHACVPDSRGAALLASRPVKEKLATFAPTPAVEALRPGTTGASGIFLAGDFVQTGWPATMEGAVRSGAMAAAAVMGMDPSALVLAGLRPGPLARMLVAG